MQKERAVSHLNPRFYKINGVEVIPTTEREKPLIAQVAFNALGATVESNGTARFPLSEKHMDVVAAMLDAQIQSKTSSGQNESPYVASTRLF